MGYICGPIVGGRLYDSLGFRGTTDSLMIASIVLALVYFLLNLMPAMIRGTIKKNTPKSSPVKRKRRESMEDEQPLNNPDGVP